MKEKEHIVAFIDILGFGNIMRFKDDSYRSKIIGLLENINKNHNSGFGIEENSISGFVVQRFSNPNISSFSDNVIISIPINDPLLNSSSQFVHNLFSQLISIVWQGLELGILFRGYITLGKLYHNNNVVAGEALVEAVKKEEKEIKYPRIGIDKKVLELIKEKNLLDNSTIDYCTIENEGKFYLRSLGFHRVITEDYFHRHYPENQWPRDEIQKKDINSFINSIRGFVGDNLDILDKKTDIYEKWKWFKEEFEKEQESEYWQNFLN